MQRIGNWFVRLVLRSPLHRMMSGFLTLLTYRGRRSGTSHTVPVGYHDDGDGITVLVGRAGDKTWWRNLRGGAAVSLRLRGAVVAGKATVVEGADAARFMEAYLVAMPRSAAAFGIETDAGGVPPEALAEALDRIPVVRIVRDAV
jgi:deazaflavin-dependent oxidoreductase (nitroreductase family)